MYISFRQKLSRHLQTTNNHGEDRVPIWLWIIRSTILSRNSRIHQLHEQYTRSFKHSIKHELSDLRTTTVDVFFATQ